MPVCFAGGGGEQQQPPTYFTQEQMAQFYPRDHVLVDSHGNVSYAEDRGDEIQDAMNAHYASSGFIVEEIEEFDVDGNATVVWEEIEAPEPATGVSPIT